MSGIISRVVTGLLILVRVVINRKWQGEETSNHEAGMIPDLGDTNLTVCEI
jgi:hypothetical protein